MSLRGSGWWGAWVGAAAIGAACGGAGSDDGDASCPVGALECSCTVGGACDAGLLCIEGRCIHAGLGTDDGGPPSSSGGGATADGTTGGGPVSTGMPDPDTTAGVASSSEGGGPIFDVGGRQDVVGVPVMGCQAIDMLFAIDSSSSMAAERGALAAVGAFTQVITTLEGLNGGGIDYRIGVTSSSDHGFLVPPGWFEPDPWFDSQALTAMEVANAFNGAVGQLGALGDPPPGCEHVLTSAAHLLDGDPSGFVRPDALLVLVLLTDVDDYGAYDQQGGNTCGIGCTTPPPPLMDLYDALVAVKDGLPEGLAAIVVAGDPGVTDGFNFCTQPGSCGCVEIIPGFADCEIFHATRLYDFTELLGVNGYAADLCAGAASVPTAVETALTESIEIACQSYEPPG
jgi:hypothetical protein